MQLEISTASVDVVVSRASQLKNDNDGRQKADQDIGGPVQGSELVAMVDPGAEVTKVRITEQPGVTTRPACRGGHAGHHSVESQLARPAARMRAAYVRASLRVRR